MAPSDLHEEFEEIPIFAAIFTMINYAILTTLAHVRDFLRNHGFESFKGKKDLLKVRES